MVTASHHPRQGLRTRSCATCYSAEFARRYRDRITVNAFSPGLIADPNGFFRNQNKVFGSAFQAISKGVGAQKPTTLQAQPRALRLIQLWRRRRGDGMLPPPVAPSLTLPLSYSSLALTLPRPNPNPTQSSPRPQPHPKPTLIRYDACRSVSLLADLPPRGKDVAKQARLWRLPLTLA